MVIPIASLICPSAKRPNLRNIRQKQDERRLRRRPLYWVLCLAIAVVVAALGAFFLFRSPPSALQQVQLSLTGQTFGEGLLPSFSVRLDGRTIGTGTLSKPFYTGSKILDLDALFEHQETFTFLVPEADLKSAKYLDVRVLNAGGSPIAADERRNIIVNSLSVDGQSISMFDAQWGDGPISRAASPTLGGILINLDHPVVRITLEPSHKP